MGGYAFFVWSSYSLTALLLIGVVLWSSFQFKKTRAQAFKRAMQHKTRKLERRRAKTPISTTPGDTFDTQT